MSSLLEPKWLRPLLSIVIVYLLTSAHHVYGAWLYDTPWRSLIAVQGMPFLLLSIALLVLYQKLGKTVFYWLLIVVAGFFFVTAIGLYEGGYNHVLKNILFFSGMSREYLLALYPPPKYELPSDVFFELTGVLTFITSIDCARQLFFLGRKHRDIQINMLAILPVTFLLLASFLAWFVVKDPFGFKFILAIFFLLGSLMILFYQLLRYFLPTSRWWKAISVGIFSVGLAASLFGVVFMINPDYFLKSEELTTDQWKADIDQLRELLETRHADFEKVYPGNIEIEVEGLKSRFTFLTDEAIKFELMKLVANMNVSHSLISPFQAAFNTSLFPIKTHYFSDGLFITDTPNQLSHLVGGKIIGIEDHSLQEIEEILSRYIPAEAYQHKKVFIPYYLMNAELLFHEGIISSRHTMTFRVERSAKSIAAKISAVSFIQAYLWLLRNQPDPQAKQPVTFQFSPDLYSFKLLSDKALYMQFNESYNGDEPLDSFCLRMEEVTKSCEVNRFILDLRNHTGGDLYNNTPLIQFLNKHFSEFGQLYVLTSAKTASAAVELVDELRMRMEPILVGAPMANGPNMYSNPRNFTLTNSGVVVELSSFNHHLARNGEWSMPYGAEHQMDYLMPYLSEDFFNKWDPQLDFARSHEPENRAIKNSIKLDTTLLLGAYQVVKVEGRSNSLNLSISDFSDQGWFDSLAHTTVTLPNVIDKDLFGSRSIGFYTRDSLIQILPKNDTLSLTYFDKFWPLVPIPANYEFPMKLLAEGKLDKAIVSINNFPERIPPGLEARINSYGYYHLQHDDIEQALKFFRLNVEVYPNSANVYDSLAEALLSKGDKSQARKYYEKAYELRPSERVAKILEGL